MQGLKGVENIYIQHKPLLNRIMEELFQVLLFSFLFLFSLSFFFSFFLFSFFLNYLLYFTQGNLREDLFPILGGGIGGKSKFFLLLSILFIHLFIFFL